PPFGFYKCHVFLATVGFLLRKYREKLYNITTGEIVSDNILKNMNRKVTRDKIERIIAKIRSMSETNIIRTTFITGLPGESEKEFDELHNFIEDTRFDRLGVFSYSPEEDTRAFDMSERVSEEVASERQDLLMSLQQEIAFEKNIALIDKIQKVIIDEIDESGQAVGRSMGDCPDIDQLVIINDNHLKPGDIVEVRIIEADGYDLIGTIGE
ncbi:MAG: TRAM domain-containing protein, partial [Candidatus Zixiibacteriota bacterium]